MSQSSMASPTGRPARRGRLTVYLGAAPGVGKTYAMLGEAQRRVARGTDLVVGYVETHGRPRTVEMLEGMEVLPRAEISYRGTTFTELDTEAVLARAPAVVLVDELAHTNIPGSGTEKRAEDIGRIRAAGIDVITTVNIQHLESLNDEVERITGVRQRETVPDEVVRTADQIQLVDMAPDALRRRMAHGNVYKPENVDASLASYFRVGNLTALRELALLWLADRVDDALGDYRRAHRIEHPWPTKERIVVAVTGGPESETLLRRGARLAQRAAGSELLAVHVIATDGLRAADERTIARVQQLTAAVGGTFHSVVGEDVPAAVVDFAEGANATMIVVGVSRHGRLRRLFTGTTGDRTAEVAGAIDVHLVTHDLQGSSGMRAKGLLAPPLSRERQVLGLVGAVALPAGLAAMLHVFSDTDQLPVASFGLMAATVLVALVGGLLPALLAALVAFVFLNWWFTEPRGTLSIAQPSDAIALIVFVAVAIAVATVVDGAARRTTDARRARAEAATIGSLSRSVLTGQDTAEAVVERVREVFGQDSVALLEHGDAGWSVLAASGARCVDDPARADTTVVVDDIHRLALCGDALRASDRRVLEGFAVQTSLVLEYRRLRERDFRAQALEKAEATSTALLRAVGHDLRTPLAIMRTALDGLMLPDLGAEDRDTMLATVAEAMRRSESVTDNLLDLSRVQSGLVRARLEPHSLEEVLPLVVAGTDAVELELDETTPLVSTDPGLLERIVDNLVANAVRASGGRAVRILVHTLAEHVEIQVVDQGPGVGEEQRQRMFEPFQRLGDQGPTGLGLGLAVARGLTEAVGGTLTPEDTPGGGLTMVLTLPRAQPVEVEGLRSPVEPAREDVT
ncbi:sensor histidine kinase [Marmoricola endophyticus]|uniref:histidine kinase n=1 Tax=Marmoricola endophyticus TaxID=2040280 RepID=A0A917BJK1_9ACTN|nr:ATP-binding protein [Marmoricola endophyticus]GGF46368.1 sensor histidine kinase [Marmoricola endophyticus]